MDVLETIETRTSAAKLETPGPSREDLERTGRYTSKCRAAGAGSDVQCQE